jgi:hypothetical protein
MSETAPGIWPAERDRPHRVAVTRRVAAGRPDLEVTVGGRRAIELLDRHRAVSSNGRRGAHLDRGNDELISWDGDTAALYTLSRRGSGSLGWTGVYVEADGSTTVHSLRLTTAEVMAMARDLAGPELERAVANLTRAAAAGVARRKGKQAKAAAARLRREVRAGYRREMVAVRPIQAAILERLVHHGETTHTLCVRGGFLTRSGEGDTSWLQRRAGLAAETCGRTGRRYRRRVVSYAIFVRLIEAVNGDPHEYDL